MSKQDRKTAQAAREAKHADAWRGIADSYPAMGFEAASQLQSAYPAHEQPQDAVWIGSGDSV